MESRDDDTDDTVKSDTTEDDEETEEDISDSEETIDESFVEENQQFDLTILVESHKIRVSKAVLCIASPVFRAMLESDFKEKEQKEIELPGKKYSDMVEFLSCIYPDRLRQVTEETVYFVLPLASEYQVQVLLERCEVALIHLVKSKHYSNATEVFKHIQLAELYNLEHLRQRCLLLASEFKLRMMESTNTSITVSDRSLMEMKNVALLRYELDRMDDAFIANNWTCKKQLREAITQNSYSVTPETLRLQQRYFPNDTELIEKSQTTMSRKTYFPSRDTVLLPEIIKQRLHLKDDDATVQDVLSLKISPQLFY